MAFAEADLLPLASIPPPLILRRFVHMAVLLQSSRSNSISLYFTKSVRDMVFVICVYAYGRSLGLSWCICVLYIDYGCADLFL